MHNCADLSKMEEIKQVLWDGAKPWPEFAKEFKPPSHIDKRVKTNLLYYKTNYAQVTTK